MVETNLPILFLRDVVLFPYNELRIEVSTELYFSATSAPLFAFGAVTFGSGVMYKKITLTLRKADSSQSGQGYNRPIKNLNGYTSYGTSIELYNIII